MPKILLSKKKCQETKLWTKTAVGFSHLETLFRTDQLLELYSVGSHVVLVFHFRWQKQGTTRLWCSATSPGTLSTRPSCTWQPAACSSRVLWGRLVVQNILPKEKKLLFPNIVTFSQSSSGVKHIFWGLLLQERMLSWPPSRQSWMAPTYTSNWHPHTACTWSLATAWHSRQEFHRNAGKVWSTSWTRWHTWLSRRYR